MAEFTYQWHGQQVLASMKREMRNRLRMVASETRSHIARNLKVSAKRGSRQGREGSSLPGEYPRAVQGALWKSIADDIVSDELAIVGVLKESPAAKYARRLEEGGKIISHGKFMAIPISWEAKTHSLSGQGPRTFDHRLTRIKRPGKTMLLVEIPTKRSGFGAGVVQSTRAAWIIHYVLSPIVTIMPRPFISRGVQEMLPRIKAILEAPMSL